MDLNKVKARIAKLLAMAENNGNEHEAAQAADRARRCRRLRGGMLAGFGIAVCRG